MSTAIESTSTETPLAKASVQSLTVTISQFRAIRTRYLRPTNRRGTRVKAHDDHGNSVTIDYDYDLPRDEVYVKACRLLCEKMGWTGRLVGGATDPGYVFVFVEEAELCAS